MNAPRLEGSAGDRVSRPMMNVLVKKCALVQ